MSATRDPDRIFRAWLEQMPDEAPDRTIAAVLQATAGAPQVRALPRIGRWRLPMNRLSLIAALVAIGLAALGGAMLFTSGHSGPAPAVPTPAATEQNAPVPAALRTATWVADAQPIAAPGLTASDPRIRFDALGAGETLVLRLAANAPTLASRSLATGAGQLRLITDVAVFGCAVGDVGTYRIAPASAGQTLDNASAITITAIADACATRLQGMSRTWVRAVDRASAGGSGVIADLDPIVQLTLPTGAFTSDKLVDATTLTSTTLDRTLIVVRNPVGFDAPCTATGGAPRPVGSTIASWVAYFSALPGFTVKTSDLTIGGSPASLLTLPMSASADCPSGMAHEWTVGSTSGWLLHPGETDVVYLVEVGGDLYLLQWLGGGVTTAEEQALWATVVFLDALPSVAP